MYFCVYLCKVYVELGFFLVLKNCGNIPVQ